jgi:hypothetical protein
MHNRGMFKGSHGRTDENHRIPQSKSRRYSDRVPPEDKARTLLLRVHQSVWSEFLLR